jgi:RNA polymerase sigma-70 factor (ECF subfamily)
VSDPTTQPISCAPPCVAEPAEPARWFREEVHAHDSQLKSYLRGLFPAVRDVDDVVQESYLRIWKRHTASPIGFAKAFLFRVARNVALDLLRRRRTSLIEPVGDLAALDVMDDKPDAADALTADERIALLVESLDCLPSRCRTIVIRCKLQGHSHRDIASDLGISEKTVAEHVYRGAQRLGEELHRRGVHSFGR